jgi:hypothetical protein
MSCGGPHRILKMRWQAIINEYANWQKKKLAHSSTETVSAWKCYKCNLIFHEKSLAFLHEDISSHSAVRVEYDYGRPKLIKESLGLVVETFTNQNSRTYL